MRLMGVTAAIAIVTLCSLLPFLPGRFDSLAIALSGMAQVVGTAGLQSVLFAAILLAADRAPSRAPWRLPALVLTLMGAGIAWVLVALAALVYSGAALALIVLGIGVFAAHRIWQAGVPPSLPAYLVAVPLAAALVQWIVVPRAIDSSRVRAMQNAAPLIAAIEEYRATNGRYPVSLLAEGADFLPGVIGVDRYHYEPHVDAYNLVFEQFTYRLGTREFVVYNPRDEQVFTAHASDILSLTPSELALERRRGHYEELLAALPHWKIFRFD